MHFLASHPAVVGSTTGHHIDRQIDHQIDRPLVVFAVTRPDPTSSSDRR